MNRVYVGLVFEKLGFIEVCSAWVCKQRLSVVIFMLAIAII